VPIVESLRLGDMAKSEPVPEAVYRVRIGKVEEKVAEPTEKNPDPYPYAEIHFVIQEPEEYLGRHVFDMCTYAPGKNFALRQLGEALGLTEDDDMLELIRSGQLVDQELQIAVSVEKARKDPRTGKQYDARNRVTKRMPLTS
jgi:hypothetical protein